MIKSYFQLSDLCMFYFRY